MAAGGERPDEETVQVIMRSREFIPDRITLHQGRKTRLIFHNQDSELHAFAPLELFTGTSFNLSGNGAPEFGPDGLKRVIIPADGMAEIRFVPGKPGLYPYICDMPGHQMKAVIAVE
jgi:plastocyanin